MTYSACFPLAWLVVLALVQPADPGPAPLPRKPLTVAECQPLQRLTLDQVRDRLGPPHHVSRQILRHRYLEQWTYEHPWRIRVEFDYRGPQPQLLTVQPLDLPRP